MRGGVDLGYHHFRPSFDGVVTYTLEATLHYVTVNSVYPRQGMYGIYNYVLCGPAADYSRPNVDYVFAMGPYN